MQKTRHKNLQRQLKAEKKLELINWRMLETCTRSSDSRSFPLNVSSERIKVFFSPEIERIIIAEIQFIAQKEPQRVEASLIHEPSARGCFTSLAFLPFAAYISPLCKQHISSSGSHCNQNAAQILCCFREINLLNLSVSRVMFIHPAQRLRESSFCRT